MPLSGNEADLPEPTNVTSSLANAVIIHPQGEVLLDVKFYDSISKLYRVSTVALRENSDYFDALLDSNKFSEGVAVESKLAGLHKIYTDITLSPASELPRVTLSDVGVGANAIHSAVEASFDIFLEILHSSSPPRPEGSKSHIRKLYSFIAYFADRFFAVNAVRSYMLKHWSDVLCMRSNLIGNSTTKSSKEITQRQMLYIGLVLDFPNLVEHYSAALVIWGSNKWLDVHEESGTATWEGLPWNPLGWGIEEELELRRACVLQHIASLQDYFLRLYSSREIQCKLNYDSSPQCDSFQLGEMIRFFTRKGTLSLQNTFVGSYEGTSSFNGDIGELLKTLKECPSYQIDRNHAHCGLRSRIIPRLAHMRLWTEVGICLSCWKKTRADYSWLESPYREEWRFGEDLKNSEGSPCGACHKRSKMAYTSLKKDWTRAY